MSPKLSHTNPVNYLRKFVSEDKKQGPSPVKAQYFNGRGAPLQKKDHEIFVARKSIVPLVRDSELNDFVQNHLSDSIKQLFPKIFEKNANPEKIIFSGGLSLRCDLIESYFKMVINLSDKFIASKIAHITALQKNGSISSLELSSLKVKFNSPNYKKELILKLMNHVKDYNQRKIKLVSPQEWIAGIHEEHLSHKWGQTPYQLPPFFQQYMTHVKPESEYENLSQFGHIQKFYNDTFSMCESLGFPADKRKISMNGISQDGQVSFENGPPLQLQTENFVVFSSIRNERLAGPEIIKVFNAQNEELQDKIWTAKAEPHARLLYSQSASSLPDTLLTAGASVSGIWLSLYLPEKNIITIVQKTLSKPTPASYKPTALLKEKLEARLNPVASQLDSEKRLPWLKLIWEGSLKKIILQDGLVRVTGLDANFVEDVPVVLFEGSESEFQKIFSQKFSAAGIETFAPFAGLKSDQYIKAQDIGPSDGYMSTKNTPPGSLGSLILYNQLALGQFDILQLFRATNEAWSQEFKIKMEEQGIVIPDGFLQKIKEIFSDAMFDQSPKNQLEIHELVFKNYYAMEIFPAEMDEQWAKYETAFINAYQNDVMAFETVSAAVQGIWINP